MHFVSIDIQELQGYAIRLERINEGSNMDTFYNKKNKHREII